MQLKPNTLLQGGKYKIIRALGQGGFGITYEAEQVLRRRKVAVKEFFMKDCCERDDATSRVTVGTGSQRALVEKFRGKFIREAQMIAGMEHPHIIRVTDVFEENDTAYYVMDYLPGGSLVDQVKRNGPLSEDKAEKYIRQVADALNYIHSQNTVHLDVKPSNILLNAKGEAILIDFGISKHYDDSGDQTSSTPVGISKGYAPLEQGRDGDVSQFKPSTDIYALGATLYYLITGVVPPEASLVNEDGLTMPQSVSDRIRTTIDKAMQPRRKDRPQDINDFLALLDDSQIDDDDKTELKYPVKKLESEPRLITNRDATSSNKLFSSKQKWLFILLGGLAIVGLIIGLASKHDSVIDDGAGTSTPSETKPPSSAQETPSPVQETPGTIKFSTEPSGATIWLDGKNSGRKTPAVFDGIAPGKHSYRLVLDGYSVEKGNVMVTSGKRTNITKALTLNQTNQNSQSSTVSGSTPTSNPTSSASPRLITGTVRTAETKAAIMDVVVTVADTKESTTTGSSGTYAIQAAPGQTLVFTDRAHKTVSVRVENSSTIDVSLHLVEAAISGTVRDRNNALIPGVVVTVAETGETTTTAGSGQYTIRARPGHTLVFTNHLFKTERVKVETNHTRADVYMTPKDSPWQ